MLIKVKILTKEFDGLNKIELKKMGKKIEKSYPKIVLSAFPQNI